MLPLFPLLALAGIFGGSALWIWYYELSEEQKREADQIANNYARSLFGKRLNQLNSAEAKQVHDLTKQHFED